MVPTVYRAVASGAGIGQLGPIPTLKSKVRVKFLDASPYYPIYYGGVTTEDVRLGELTGEPIEEGEEKPEDDDYLHAYGKIDRSGNRWFINTKRDTYEFTHVTGTQISIDGHGRVQIDIADGAVDNLSLIHI